MTVDVQVLEQMKWSLTGHTYDYLTVTEAHSLFLLLALRALGLLAFLVTAAGLHHAVRLWGAVFRCFLLAQLLFQLDR